ncbi:unnamed protein product [Danaus chrysippus]|uniref:(African queen) hypothetical protein n=1 Tax=Danaus chrysippus TaxID=151541 RepID=A0A8J2Q9W4_9NEOP|nr:unnamed protein product [Danaus chrysippus]
MREAPARAALSPAGRQSIVERLASGTCAASTLTTLTTIVETRLVNKLYIPKYFTKPHRSSFLSPCSPSEYNSYRVLEEKMCWIYVSLSIVIEQVQLASGR